MQRERVCDRFDANSRCVTKEPGGRTFAGKVVHTYEQALAQKHEASRSVRDLCPDADGVAPGS